MKSDMENESFRVWCEAVNLGPQHFEAWLQENKPGRQCGSRQTRLRRNGSVQVGTETTGLGRCGGECQCLLYASPFPTWGHTFPSLSLQLHEAVCLGPG